MKKVLRKAQVAAFIIIGIVIIGTLALLMYGNNVASSAKLSAGISTNEFTEVNQLIQSCVELETVNAVISIGKYDNFYSNSILYLDNIATAIIYTPENGGRVPSIDEWMFQIEQLSAERITSCFYGYEVDDSDSPFGVYLSSKHDDDIGNFSVEASLISGNDEGVDFTVTAPLQFEFKNAKFTTGKFSSEVPVPLEKMNHAVQRIVSSLEENGGLLDFVMLQSIEEEFGVEIEVMASDSVPEIIFKITAPDSSVAGAPYSVYFAAELVDLPDNLSEIETKI